ncbi:MAG: hypothetical protein K6G00_10820 [Treponema sp.]|nr:hypothetical protein [Treponema sp.]
MKLNLQQFIVKNFWKKFIVVASAIFFMGFTLSFLIEAAWGTDPCSFMNINISNKIGWTLGNWQFTLNLIMLIFTIAFNPRLIGVGTILNMVLIGYTADFFTWLWKNIGFHAIVTNPDFFYIRVIVFIAAIIFFVISAAVYMNSEMGLSPYDAAIKIISSKINKIPYFIIRIIYDLLAIVIGLIAGKLAVNGVQGSMLGSTIMAFAIGPAITAVGKFMKKHISIFKES